MALQIAQTLVEGFDENISYLIYCDVSKEAIIIDPSGTFALVEEKITQLQLQVVAVLLTHTHADHVDALNTALGIFPVPVFVHEKGVSLITAEQIQPIVDGNEIELGEGIISLFYTPGHSEDSICALFASVGDQPILITGDTLFIDGCGRTTDGEAFDLYNSLQFIKSLPGETVIYPGHNYGPVVVDTLSSQLLTNRFLQAQTFSDFCLERLGYTINT